MSTTDDEMHEESVFRETLIDMLAVGQHVRRLPNVEVFRTFGEAGLEGNGIVVQMRDGTSYRLAITRVPPGAT
jgi:hypothetical protein